MPSIANLPTGLLKPHDTVAMGPTAGFADIAAGVAEATFDLSGLECLHVTVAADGADVYVAFMGDAVTPLVLGTATLLTMGVPALILDGTVCRIEVPYGFSYLRYRTKVGAGAIRVIVG